METTILRKTFAQRKRYLAYPPDCNFFACYVNKVCRSAVQTEMLTFPTSQFSHLRKGFVAPVPPTCQAAGQGQSSAGSADPTYCPGVWAVTRTQSSLLPRGLGAAPLPHCFMGHGKRISLTVLRDYDIWPQGSRIQIPVFLSSPLPAYYISV